ncbi:drug resistance transporter, EmrB/QacA subfamily [Chitinophaga jiangningensis]|uniref:Drug resistance transporter, EmrB/QacA subfamily n=1 Tax=Chitinophaga jiangningensis TaxID=1419482 RepID=A0A1M7BRA3_9BACT|nr:MFS transporter [Chitinophaga jiangningensis]SHL57565.1 drug resistance transporter, EmrB/QacA subfamily [Chitinophaga jiangningensis]
MKATVNKWLALVVVLTAPLLYVIDIFVINIAIPTIKRQLHASDGEIQLVIAAYLLGSACFLIIGGRAGDFLGKKKVFFWGMFAFTITSCICGLSQNATQLNIARFLQGVSSAFMVTQSISLIQLLFTESKERAAAIGWYGITLSIAAIIGQVLGGYLAETHLVIAGWRLIFFINLPVGILSLFAIHFYLAETPRLEGIKFDYKGAVVLTIGLACLIYALTEGRDSGFPSWFFWLLLASVLLLLYFVAIQKRKLANREFPLIDVLLFKLMDFRIGLFAVLFHFMFHTAYLLIIAVYLQSGLGVDAVACGMYFVPHAIFFMISSMIAGKLLPRYGKSILQLGLGIILLSFLLQIFFFTAYDRPLVSMLFLAIYGLGNGFVLPFLLNVVLNNISQEDAGAASGIFSTFQQTASALGISIIGGIFYAVLDTHTNNNNYLPALQMGLAAGIVCLLVVWRMLSILPDTGKPVHEAAHGID